MKLSTLPGWMKPASTPSESSSARNSGPYDAAAFAVAEEQPFEPRGWR